MTVPSTATSGPGRDGERRGRRRDHEPENSSRVPTTWTAMVVARASSTMNTTPRARTGTPFASATCGFTDANVSGRAMAASTSTSTAVNTANTTSWSVVIASRLPNSTLVTVLALFVANELNSTPRPVANTRIVPVAISRSATFLPRNPMASAPAIVNTANPTVIRTPDEHGAGGPREPDVRESSGRRRRVGGRSRSSPRAHGDHNDAADEGVAHEVGLQHVDPVRLVARRTRRPIRHSS